VNARLQVATLKDATVIPAAALQLSSDGDFVYVVKADSTIERRSVKSGPDFGDDQVAILSGVNPGEQVVTTGVDRLNNGTKVEIVTPNSANAATTGSSSKERLQSGGVDKASTGADKTIPAPDATSNTAGKDSGSK